MPPVLSARQQPAPSYSPVMHVLGRPLQYLLFSLITFCTSILLIRVTHNESNITMLLQNSSYPIVIGIVTLNLLLSIFLCVYYLLNGIFFGTLPNMTELTIIVEKLFNFFSFKIVLVGMVIEADIYDFSLWIVWYVVLASVKAILQFGLIRLNILVESSNPTIFQYIRPSSHLLFGFIFVLYEFYFWGTTGRGHGPPGLWMLILFDLVTFTIELIQSAAIHIIYIVKASANHTSSSTTSSSSSSSPAVAAVGDLSNGVRASQFLFGNHKSIDSTTDKIVLVISSLSALVFKSFKLEELSLFAKSKTKVFETFNEISQWAQNTDFEEVQYTIELYTEILILGISLIHYFHVFMIHGLTLSLVDIFLLFNIISTGTVHISTVRAMD